MANKPKDMELWHRVARSAKPLEGRERHEAYRMTREAAGRKAGEAPRSTQASSTVSRPMPAPAKSPTAAGRSGSPCLAHGQVVGLDRRTAERLKRGRLSVEARLDLHGMTQAEAHRALNAFVAASYEVGRRCLLVITGKGLNREDGGVLRGKVPLWLNQNPNRGRVLAFDYAQQRDGGTGALYVMLRRRR